jgi:lysine/ornithine N-monooxygenase
MEFHDYLEWAAAGFAEQVDYSREVVEIRPVAVGDRVPAVDVVTSGPGGDAVTRARNVVLAMGLIPHLPPGIRPGSRVWHSSTLLHEIADVLTSDVVVFAAGYRPVDPRGMLGELAEGCRTDRGGRLEISRDYRLATDDAVTLLPVMHWLRELGGPMGRYRPRAGRRRLAPETRCR